MRGRCEGRGIGRGEGGRDVASDAEGESEFLGCAHFPLASRPPTISSTGAALTTTVAPRTPRTMHRRRMRIRPSAAIKTLRGSPVAWGPSSSTGELSTAEAPFSFCAVPVPVLRSLSQTLPQI